MTPYHPLHEPDEAPTCPWPVDVETNLARQVLDEFAAADIHSHTAMLRAALNLDHRLRTLIAAMDAERGEPR